MDKKQYELISKVHDELIKRLRIEADKYEREDAFFGTIDAIEKGVGMKEAFIKTFDLVYDAEVPDVIYESCYALCKGWK
jgi:hypothetical protein